ncbi:hypothetical protein BT69DRAFT_1188555, partial [Atractiella rhizophila]
ILSLDGGGTWAFAELCFLRKILQELWYELSTDEGAKYGSPENIQPYKFFDLIVGSSTGGLLAFMLGSLKMSVKETMDAFEDLCEKLF